MVAFVEQLERAGLAIAHGLDEPRVADVLPASLEERRHRGIIGIRADAERPEQALSVQMPLWLTLAALRKSRGALALSSRAPAEYATR